MQAVVIANPAARLVASNISLTSIESCLSEAGLETELQLTHQKGDATRLARAAAEAGARRVVAVGGDGTINEVVQGLAGSETELAIVPLGTGNVVARNAGLDDKDMHRSCSVAAGGKVRTVDLGLMGDRYFLATAGAGIDAEVARNLDPWWKHAIGKLAFVAEFFRTLLLEEPRIFTVTVGSQVVTGPMWGVLICNTNEYTWRIRPVPDAREDDGLLDAIFLHRQGYLDLVDLAARMFVAGEPAVGHPTVTVLRVGEMNITAAPPVYWQVEGDVGGMTPVKVRAVPGALKLVVAPPG